MSEQFEDAPYDTTLPPETQSDIIKPPTKATYIHDSDLEWSDSDEGDEIERLEVEYDAYEDEKERAAEDYDVDDEDWEIAEKDFTKQYNRLRLHNAVQQGNFPSNTSGTGKNSGTVLPAINRPKPARQTNAANTGAPSALSTGSRQNIDKRMTDRLTTLAKYSSRISNIDAPYAQIQPSGAAGEGSTSNEPFTLGVSVNPKGPSATANQKDKSDRATSENVLDPRTMIILYKMIGRGLVKEINGCVSTGKEANVYHALAGPLLTDPLVANSSASSEIKSIARTKRPDHLALKVYKTSILTFRDRDRYISGEHRFMRSGYSRHNPRKMVRMWAEKEMRNLKRLRAAGIASPEVYEVRQNVLVMSFVGDTDGWASPRLKDASIPAEEYQDLYQSLMLTVRKMYHVCKLVHADLSEYNILYHRDTQTPSEISSADTPEATHGSQQDKSDTSQAQGDKGILYIIDVSQSVEHDHPSAYDFLRSDLKNVKRFFEGWGVRCLSLRRAFEFVTQETLNPASLASAIGSAEEEETLKAWIDEDLAKGSTGNDAGLDENEETELERRIAATKASEDSVFLNSFIPRNFNEMVNPERVLDDHPQREQEKADKEKRPRNLSRVRFDNVPKQEQETDEDSEEEDDPDAHEAEIEEQQEGDEKEGFSEKKPRGHRHEDREAKKERKKVVKEEQREKRKTKMPKAEKKKRIKTSRGGN